MAGFRELPSKPDFGVIMANHEIDCFVSLEESYWAELGISTITRVGKSSIYYVLNKDRSDLKEELDNAMRASI